MNTHLMEQGNDIRPLSSAELEAVNGGAGFLVGVLVGVGIGFGVGVLMEELKPFSGTLKPMPR